MFLGHYGIAFAAKRVASTTSLGTLILAAQWLDELWPIFLLLGVERVKIVPGLMPANPLDFAYYPYSHSLLASIVWGLLLGGVYYAARRNRRAAIVVGLLVVSHWVLDVPMHRADLPLWPGASPRIGLGAWRSVPLTIAIELVVLAWGLTVYLRTTRARDRVGTWALWGMIAFLVIAYFSAQFGAPPPNERFLAQFALTIWLFVPWGYWIDRHRVSRKVDVSV
jgi:hypothetical protein